MKLEGKLKIYLFNIVENVVSCGRLLVTNRTIYFASDSHEVVRDDKTRSIPLDGGIQVRSIGVHRDKEPLHSNQTSWVTNKLLFPIFEDCNRG